MNLNMKGQNFSNSNKNSILSDSNRNNSKKPKDPNLKRKVHSSLEISIETGKNGKDKFSIKQKIYNHENKASSPITVTKVVSLRLNDLDYKLKDNSYKKNNLSLIKFDQSPFTPKILLSNPNSRKASIEKVIKPKIEWKKTNLNIKKFLKLNPCINSLKNSNQIDIKNNDILNEKKQEISNTNKINIQNEKVKINKDNINLNKIELSPKGELEKNLFKKQFFAKKDIVQKNNQSQIKKSHFKNTSLINKSAYPNTPQFFSQKVSKEKKKFIENDQRKMPKSELNERENIHIENLNLQTLTINESFDINSSKISEISLNDNIYYQNQSEKLSNLIKEYYVKNAEYPPTNQNFYKYGRLLGRGAFGKVNLGLHLLTGRLVAIKSFNKNNLKSENAKKKIYYEISLLKKLKHMNVINIFEHFESQKYILLIMENICGGDLLSFVRKRTKLNETTAKFIYRQIIDALIFIHSQNIVHRDIKLDNILIDLNNTIKICDFGVSKLLKKGEIMKDQCGTPAYIAPEILKNVGYEGFSCDIWSSGVVLYALLSGTVPFKSNKMEDLHKIIMKGQYLKIDNISPEANHLISMIFQVDPRKRITLEQIINHPWLNQELNRANMNLFTQTEKIVLSKNFADYRNSQKSELIEIFTLKYLDTELDSENKNVKTKSLLLGPFNSSFKQDEDNKSDDLVVEKKIVRFVGKTRDANRNYELNNNNEIDNGILIQNQNFIISPEGSFGKQEVCSSPGSPYELNLNRKFTSIEFYRNSNGFSCDTSTANTNIFDENILKIIAKFGYSKEFIIRSINSNQLNYATTAYFLMVNAKN